RAAGPRRARPPPRPHRGRPRLHQLGDAVLQAHARDNRRPRTRGDPAPGDRLLDDAVRDDLGHADLARLLPGARPDAALRVSADRAQGPPVATWRRALG